jgi:hypothetical protein
MTITAYISIVTALVAIGTLWRSIAEYVRQGATKRAEQFLEMRTRLRTNPEFVEICELLETDSPRLHDVPLLQKDNFIGFYEELALLWNSRVFNDQIVFYMFGYFALACWRSEHFWWNLNREQQLWAHFRDLVQRLEAMERSFVPSRKAYRL